MFKSVNFIDIGYLNFNPDFHIYLGDKSKIIFAPNKIGKSSIYTWLKEHYTDYKYVDYDNLKFNFIKNRKKIEISANISAIEKSNSIKQSLLDTIDLVKNIKSYISKKPEKTKNNEKYYNMHGDNEKLLLEFTTNNFDNISTLSNDIEFIVKNYDNIMNITTLEEELGNLKKLLMKEALEFIEKQIDDDTYECPVCGTKKTENIIKLIAEKKTTLDCDTSELLKSFAKKNNNESTEEIINRFNRIKNKISENNILFEEIVYYVSTNNGDKDYIKTAQNIKNELIRLNKEINNLEEKRIEFYNNVKKKEFIIRDIFSHKFKGRKIEFDDQNKKVILNLKREVKTYSTSESNLMVLIVHLYEFIGSNSSIVVIDDPLTSYDLPNQYVIMYEIISTIVNQDRKGLIFTHNIDTINISSSQKNDVFDYEYIESVKDELYINSLPYNNRNVFDLGEIYNSTTINAFKPYLKLIIERDNEEKKNDTAKTAKDLIFHYDSPNHQLNIDGEKLENEYLCDLIDQFTENTFTNSSFPNNAINKIIFLAALRVWIEKQLYLNNPSDISLVGKQFGEKIEYVFPMNGNSRWNGSEKVTREFLMSKKVMLNQNEHTRSLSSPCYYALNLTLYELAEEIISIKNAFYETGI